MTALLLTMLLSGPVSDRIWYDEAYKSILEPNLFWDIPVAVENLHRDLFESTFDTYCEGGWWVADRVVRINYDDPVPPCGEPREDGEPPDPPCHYQSECDVKCNGWWGCRKRIWTCCWFSPPDMGFWFNCRGGGRLSDPIECVNEVL